MVINTTNVGRLGCKRFAAAKMVLLLRFFTAAAVAAEKKPRLTGRFLSKGRFLSAVQPAAFAAIQPVRQTRGCWPVAVQSSYLRR